jgi:hypothetical protein
MLIARCLSAMQIGLGDGGGFMQIGLGSAGSGTRHGCIAIEAAGPPISIGIDFIIRRCSFHKGIDTVRPPVSPAIRDCLNASYI